MPAVAVFEIKYGKYGKQMETRISVTMVIIIWVCFFPLGNSVFVIYAASLFLTLFYKYL